MNLTVTVPNAASNKAFSMENLRHDVEAYIEQWFAKLAAKDKAPSDDFVLPSRFEHLCGSISEERLNEQRVSDAKLNSLLEKNL